MTENGIRTLALGALLLSSTLGTFATASPANNRVELGIDSLRSGDFNTAIEWLTSAEKQQATHPDLYNALGLAYFKTHRFSQAEQYYLKALNTPRKHEAAYYLGKTYEERGQFTQASRYYQKAADQYDDLQVQTAADSALLALKLRQEFSPDRPEQLNPPRRFAFLSLETSQVDGIVDPDDSAADDESDTTTSLLAAGNLSLSPTNAELDWKVGGSFFTEKYSDFSQYDVDAYHAYTSIGGYSGDHKMEAKLGYTKFNRDGADYIDQAELALKDTLTLSKNRKLVLHGKLIDVTSPEDTYNYYAGTLTEVGGELRGGKKLKWRLGATWRTEDRNDRQTTLTNSNGDNFDGFTSYSRDWLRIRGRTSWPWSDKWQQKLELSWRMTDYQDEDQYLASSSDAALTSLRRNADRIGFKTELTREITSHLDLNLRYEYLDEDSNNDGYDFTSETISAGMSYLF